MGSDVMAGLRFGMERNGSAGGLAWMAYFHPDVRMIFGGLHVLLIFGRLFE